MRRQRYKTWRVKGPVSPVTVTRVADKAGLVRDGDRS
jgi:hypothetical protein